MKVTPWWKGLGLAIFLFLVGLAIFGGGAALGYRFSDSPDTQFFDDIGNATTKRSRTTACAHWRKRMRQ